MSLKINYRNMLADIVGNKGIAAGEIEKNRPAAESAFGKVQSMRGKQMQGWMDLPYNQDKIVGEILSYSESVLPEVEYFVVLGIGGSALGAIALFNALKHLFHNELSRNKRGAPKFYCVDSVDPERLKALFDVIEPEKTLFNVITKSGSTSETMSQYLIVADMLERLLGEEAKNHIVATTSEKSGSLIKIAKEKGYKTFYIPDGVGGRFSVLSPVGLLPAAFMRADLSALLDGARQMDLRCKNPAIDRNPALLSAMLMKTAMDKGANISVMMPYADSLRYVADFYAQLWGESLGKTRADGGHVGQTPVKALGVTDQHSQLQLYAEGPYDKVVAFIRVENFRGDVEVPKNGAGLDFLSGHTLSELTNIEQYATEYALAKAGRMNMTINLPAVDEYHLGELMYFLEMQTAYAGAMLGVNAFDQPGVEEGKNAAYALLGKQGFEQKRKELSQAKATEYTV